jgi:hypothetical protein
MDILAVKTLYAYYNTSTAVDGLDAIFNAGIVSSMGTKPIGGGTIFTDSSSKSSQSRGLVAR